MAFKHSDLTFLDYLVEVSYRAKFFSDEKLPKAIDAILAQYPRYLEAREHQETFINEEASQ